MSVVRHLVRRGGLSLPRLYAKNRHPFFSLHILGFQRSKPKTIALEKSQRLNEEMLLILLLHSCLAYQNWRNWKQAKATESVKPRSYHGKNDYRWEIAGNLYNDFRK